MGEAQGPHATRGHCPAETGTSHSSGQGPRERKPTCEPRSRETRYWQGPSRTQDKLVLQHLSGIFQEHHSGTAWPRSGPCSLKGAAAVCVSPGEGLCVCLGAAVDLPGFPALRPGGLTQSCPHSCPALAGAPTPLLTHWSIGIMWHVSQAGYWAPARRVEQARRPRTEAKSLSHTALSFISAHPWAAPWKVPSRSQGTGVATVPRERLWLEPSSGLLECNSQPRPAEVTNRISWEFLDSYAGRNGGQLRPGVRAGGPRGQSWGAQGFPTRPGEIARGQAWWARNGLGLRLPRSSETSTDIQAAWPGSQEGMPSDRRGWRPSKLSHSCSRQGPRPPRNGWLPMM